MMPFAVTVYICLCQYEVTLSVSAMFGSQAFICYVLKGCEEIIVKY